VERVIESMMAAEYFCPIHRSDTFRELLSLPDASVSIFVTAPTFFVSPLVQILPV
jgi:hypothetical protein